MTRHEFSRLLCQAWEKSMTMSNIRAGFRVTGIHPFNRNALNPTDPLPDKLPEKSGLKYVPLLTPSHKVDTSRSFTAEEDSMFEARYSKWLEKHHPEAAHLDCSAYPSETQKDSAHLDTSSEIQRKLSFVDEDDLPGYHHQTVLSKTLLSIPKPTLKFLALKENSSTRVLTSEQNLKRIEQREKEKQQKEMQKEERKKQKEFKKKEKQEQSQLRKEQRAKKSAKKSGSVKSPSTGNLNWEYFHINYMHGSVSTHHIVQCLTNMCI